MPRNCRCGGKLVDLDGNKFYFRFKCNRCGVVRTQKKRHSLTYEDELDLAFRRVFSV